MVMLRGQAGFITGQALATVLFSGSQAQRFPDLGVANPHCFR